MCKCPEPLDRPFVGMNSHKRNRYRSQPFLLLIPHFQWLPLLRTRALQGSAAMHLNLVVKIYVPECANTFLSLWKHTHINVEQSFFSSALRWPWRILAHTFCRMCTLSYIQIFLTIFFILVPLPCKSSFACIKECSLCIPLPLADYKRHFPQI